MSAESEVCKLRSPSYIEWDALSVFVECVMIKVTRPETLEQFVTDGIRLLDSLLQYDTKVHFIIATSPRDLTHDSILY